MGNLAGAVQYLQASHPAHWSAMADPPSSDAHRKSQRFCLLCATSSSLRAVILSFQPCSTKSWRHCFQKFVAAKNRFGRMACFACLVGIVSSRQGALACKALLIYEAAVHWHWSHTNNAFRTHVQLSLTRSLHLSSISTECAMFWFSLSGKIFWPVFFLPKALFDCCHNMMQPHHDSCYGAIVKNTIDISSIFCVAYCYCPSSDLEYHLEKRKSLTIRHVPDARDI